MQEDQLNNQTEQPQSEESAEAPEPGESKGTRLDAAKAFFRALNAGDEPSPQEYGMGQQQQSSSSGPCRNCSAMESQLGEVEKKASEAEGLYRRMAADFENYRRRVDREREEFQQVGVQRVLESLLPALDDMDRALMSLTSETPVEKMLESLKLVYNRINRCMEQFGVKPMVAVGEHFDPKYHEPVQEIETTDFPDGSVMHELRKGYTLNDKVIRPALVNVASNTGGSAQSDNEASAGAVVSDSVETDEAGGKVYDLSDFEDADDGDGTTAADENLETPAGKRVLDE